MNGKNRLCLRRLCAGFLAAQIWASAPSLQAATPPANDTCAGAVVIPAAGPFPYLTAVVPDITGATTTGDPPAPSCSTTVARSIWYKFTPATAATYNFSVCSETATTVGDTVMAIYTSSAGCAGPFTEVNCNDDACGLFGLRSSLTQPLAAGVTYYVVVWMFSVDGSPPAVGETALQLRVSRPVPPPNDTCSGAEIIPSAGPFPRLTGISDLVLATADGDPPPPSCQWVVRNSVWYGFTPAVSATYRFSTCLGTATTLNDSILGIYTSKGTCGGPFTEVACGDDECGLLADINVPLSAGTTYYIVVWAYDNGVELLDANVQIRVSIFSLPVVTTGAATGVGSTVAGLHGSVKPNGSDTWAWFEWGPTTDYGGETEAQPLGSGTTLLPVSDSLNGLMPNSFLHYRLVATNLDGTTAGADMTFSTTGATEQRFTLQERLPNGQFRIQFIAPTGQSYSVQSSSNLLNWVNRGTASSLGNGRFEFIDPTTTNAPIRFYRTRSP
jgi:hypothetical protein